MIAQNPAALSLAFRSGPFGCWRLEEDRHARVKIKLQHFCFPLRFQGELARCESRLDFTVDSTMIRFKQLQGALTTRYKDSSVDFNILENSFDRGVFSHFKILYDGIRRAFSKSVRDNDSIRIQQ
jgi:hypothetical protein